MNGTVEYYGGPLDGHTEPSTGRSREVLKVDALTEGVWWHVYVCYAFSRMEYRGVERDAAGARASGEGRNGDEQ